jgi:hypothetical protein
MRKTKQPRQHDIFEGDIDDIINVNSHDDYHEPAQWTIITALDRVLDLARGSELSKWFWESCKNPLAFLTQELGLSELQVVIVAILIESGESMSWRDFGKFLHCSRLSMMVYTEEMDNLLEKRWITRRKTPQLGTYFEGFALTKGVVTALRHNTPFVPEKIDGLSIQELVDRLESHLDKSKHDMNADFEDDEEWILQICKANPHLPLCHDVLKFEGDIHVQSLLMMIVYDYAQWADSNDEGLTMTTINHLYPEEYHAGYMRHKLRQGTHILMSAGYIEHKCVDGLADTERYTLTRRSKEELLRGYTPSKSRSMTLRDPRNDIRSYENIREKKMFYNSNEQEQIERLTDLLSQENFPIIQERLESEGLRKGFACLFYGSPGTGKTETVLQIARQTGRNIMEIEIAGMRDKYVGESEKNIKAIFARYKDVCKQSNVTPILFFNEADGIFGKRVTIDGNNPSVEKMDNAMQNIILQELENLDGILIATTNLTCNLDDAFERRFLFKVEFEKPNDEVKEKIWRSMLGDGITTDDAHRLAIRYDFSGGQIENIVRKRTIEYILSGKKAGFDEIDEFCKHELLNKKNERKPMGFQNTL